MVKSRNDRNLNFREGKWFLDFTFRGKRIRAFGGYTKEQARNALAKLRIEKLDEKLGFKKPEDVPIAFEVFADEFLQTYCKQNKKSWQGDEIHLENLKSFFKGETLQSIGPEMIERYKAKRRTEVSPASVNRGLSCLRTMFNKAVEWGRLETSPLRTIKKLKEPQGRERILSAEEARRLLDCASDAIRPVLVVALNTGMRRSEILSLKWSNVDLTRGYIFIEDSKSGKSRKIPMNAAVMEAFLRLPHEAEFVFLNSGTGEHVKDIKTAFHAACRRAKKDPNDEEDPGIVGLRFHDLRHTAASKMIEAGVDLVTVSKILGHASITMTMRYAHPTPENMRRAVERLGEILDPTRQKVDTVKVPRPASVTYGARYEGRGHDS
jgi:integrase